MTNKPPSLAAAWRYALPLLSILAVFLVLEVVFALLPVRDFEKRAPLDENPVFRYHPLQQFTWSRGWNFEVVNQVRINNYGFVSDYDYIPDATTPLTAVIGDSFVEARSVPYGESCAGRLADHMAPAGRVYSFGHEGAPLSQYLQYAQYAQETFRPHAMVFIIIANDFLESWLKYSSGAPFLQFEESDTGEPHLVQPFWEPKIWKEALKKSNLFKYIFWNLDFGVKYKMWKLGRTPLDPNVLHQSASLRPDLAQASRRAIDHFFSLLPAMTGLAPPQITFVVDAPRFALYSEEMEDIRDSHRVLNRQYFMAVARRLGYETLDMFPVFSDHWNTNRARFDWWPKDIHWNALGHSLCFEALVKSTWVGDR